VPDLSVSGDKSDLVVVDPHDPTTTSETRSANAIAEPTPDGYQPCQRKISLITVDTKFGLTQMYVLSKSY
jgi:hypothetical protein